MKKFGTKQLIPIATAIIGIVFAYIGFFQLGFWDGEPQPGFFPSIMAIVLIVGSIAAFIQTLSEEEQPKYNKNELMVILGGLALIVGSLVIGLIPTVFVYVFVWLKFIEKGTPWKDIIIIELIIAVIVLGVFAGWLQVQFPWGLFSRFM